ncbi:ATPase, partial [Klebsiella michiganensis]|nr:ATPase [Klebsiella michiganensis]
MRTVSRTDRASRLIKASAARVYQAFVDAEALVRWLPPEGMTGEMLAFDAKPGGGYR